MSFATERTETENPSQRYLSELELQDALHFAHSVVDTVRESLLVLDGALRVKFANRSFYRTFQVEVEETYNRHISELGNGQWAIPELRELLDRIFVQNEQFDDYEVSHHFPDIGQRTMLLNARTIASGEQKPHLILLAIEDVTQRRDIERALQTYVGKLERSNRELQDFAYVASHDLQEPLRAIQAFSERLRVKNGDALSDEGRDYLQRMQNAAGRMRSLIRDLLALSRVTTRGNPFVAVDLNSEARSALADVATQLEETGATIQLEELPCLEADTTQMRQLIQNLVSNSLKFRRQDVAPHIRIYSQSPEEESAGDCCIVVEDNGIGFDLKHAERIFTPFQRLHSQTKYEGTGIGLAICRKIVERHGGAITATSTLGQGATFTVTLPRKQDQGELLI
jgi:signal transduction histidine kinase